MEEPDYGYRWSIQELTEVINKTKEVDKDYPILVDGATGAGKSSIALKICIKGDPKFDIEKDVIFSRDEFIDKITNSEPGRYYLLDEAINVLFRRDFANKKQKFILRLMDMCRDKNLCLIMCVPNFWSMDKHLLEGRVKLRIHVARTGLCFLWKPSGNPFTPDKWCRKYNEKVCWNWDSYPNAKKTKGFIGYLKFGDLAEGYKQIYLRIKKEKKEMIANQEAIEEEERNKKAVEDFEEGQMYMLNMLKENGRLRPGDLNRIATNSGTTAEILGKRLQRYRQKLLLKKDDVTENKKVYYPTINNEELEDN